MKKRILLYSTILASSILSIAPILISCETNKTAYLDIDKISRRYLTRLTGNQIASLHNSQKIFYFLEGNKKIYYEEAIYSENGVILKYKNITSRFNFDFNIQTSWKQETSDLQNINIVKKNEKSNIDDFLKEYSFDDIDSANGFNDEWFSILTAKSGKDYNRTDDPYFADLQTIIFRLIQDIDINYSFMNSRHMVNKNNEAVLTKGIFKNKYIQASTWLDKDHEYQRKLFETFLLLYLSKFNVNVKKILIDWSTAKVKESYSGSSSYVVFKIKDIIDYQNKSILKEEFKNKKYYINGFRTYKTNQKFGVGLNGLKEKLPLFNEYIPNPLLSINGKQYLNVVDNINYFIKGAMSFDFWNSKGLVYLFHYLKDQILSVDIPSYKKDEDLLYKIIDVKFNHYLGTDQLFTAIIRVYKKDGTYKDYSWISSNFDDHGHRLKGQILNNKYEDELTVNDFYNFREGLNPIPKGISLNNFVSSNKNSPFAKLLERAGKALDLFYSYWNNDVRSNYEANFIRTDSFQTTILGAYLNNYLLSYALENEAGKIRSGIKKINITVLKTPSEPGRVYLRLDFIKFVNEDDNDFINKNEKIFKSVYLYWNGFKGFDKTISDSAFTLDKIEDGQ
ncbi:MAG3240 family lipoprotein [Metamycoplasma buccale]|uniref:MAG3240 family lipoprotein n=1 Tax=Metamycoplasma buccale TaxID=55602 RepID=UPI00398F2375